MLIHRMIQRITPVLMVLPVLFWGCGGKEKGELVETLETRIEHEPVKEHIGKGEAKIKVMLQSAPELPPGAVELHYLVDDNWFTIAMQKETTESYSAEIPHQDKGTIVYYYVEASTVTGAKLYLPNAAPNGKYYRLTFKGTLPPALLSIHVGLMLGTILFLLASAFFAYKIIKKGDGITLCLYLTLIAFVLFFLGGFPIGMTVEKMVFGTLWEGWPFGRDVTDTKTGFLFVYWLIILLTMKDSIFRKPEPKNWVSNKTFAYLVLIGVAITIILYLIPHENIKF